jgi:hypothetical protein
MPDSPISTISKWGTGSAGRGCRRIGRRGFVSTKWGFSGYRFDPLPTDSRNLKDSGNLVCTEKILSQFLDVVEYEEFVESFTEQKVKEIEESSW